MVLVVETRRAGRRGTAFVYFLGVASTLARAPASTAFTACAPVPVVTAVAMPMESTGAVLSGAV